MSATVPGEGLGLEVAAWPRQLPINSAAKNADSVDHAPHGSSMHRMHRATRQGSFRHCELTAPVAEAHSVKQKVKVDLTHEDKSDPGSSPRSCVLQIPAGSMCSA